MRQQYESLKPSAPSFRAWAWLMGAALALLAATPGRTQGLIIDRRPEIRTIQPCEVRELSVDATIRDQVAEVQVTQLFHNPSPVELEAELLFPLPEDGAIQNFVLMVDGKEIPGKIMARDEARRTYEDIVRRRRDPALLEFAGMGLYRTSVFPVPPGADRKVTMRYTHVLKRDNGAVEFVYPLVAQRVMRRPLPRLTVNVRIESGESIKSIYSPSHDVKIDRDGDRRARVSFEARDAAVASDFRLIYTLEKGPVGATVLSWRPERSDEGGGQPDGFFLLLASPDVKAASDKPIPKTVIFVLDRSGSMAGKKIDQARGALAYVLDNLKDDDLFNIVVYDDRVESYKPELQRVSRGARDEAHGFIDNIRPGGSTNIDEALKTALAMIGDDSRPSYIIFLTDGLPTVGERDDTTIADHVKSENSHHARIFTFGVGNDVNARLLDRVSGGNAGTTEFVKPEEDIEAKVSSFYTKMSSPVMTGIKLAMDGVDMNRVYPRELPDLFAGGQLVVVGRYAQSKSTTLRLTGRVGDRDQTVEANVSLAGPGEGRRNEYIERVWAARRIGYILDDIDMHGQNAELTDELVALSKRYGILTPYTSFLAMEDTLPPVMGRPVPMPPPRPMPYMYRGRRGATYDSGSLGGGFGGAGGGGRGGRGGAATMPGGSALGMPEMQQRAADQLATRLGGDASGAGAISDRELKAQLKSADKPAGVGAAASAAASGTVGNAVGGTNIPVTAPSGAAPGEATIRHIGEKTFYLREGAWIDSTLKPEDVAAAVKIEQFSDAYFKLIDGLSAESVKYLSFREPVTVRIKDKVYRIDPPVQP